VFAVHLRGPAFGVISTFGGGGAATLGRPQPARSQTKRAARDAPAALARTGPNRMRNFKFRESRGLCNGAPRGIDFEVEIRLERSAQEEEERRASAAGAPTMIPLFNSLRRLAILRATATATASALCNAPRARSCFAVCNCHTFVISNLPFPFALFRSQAGCAAGRPAGSRPTEGASTPAESAADRKGAAAAASRCAGQLI
jgi:hypothetical protein